MGLLNRVRSLFGQKTPAVSVDYVGQKHFGVAKEYAAVGLRQGMWVVVGGSVAIVNGLSSEVAEVHYVNEDGETVLVDYAPLTGLRQAAFNEIPEARRPEEAVAARLGYGRK